MQQFYRLSLLMLKLFESGWILIGSSFYHPSDGNKSLL